MPLEGTAYTRTSCTPGSDVSLLVNVFAWVFECFQFILNRNAADILFEDTVSYENISRLVKLLSYSPKTYSTAIAEFLVEQGTVSPGFENGVLRIPKFSSIRILEF